MKSDCKKLFEDTFSVSSLITCFTERFQYGTAKGVDRLNGYQYKSRAEESFSVASKKCLSGAFRFSPYLEVLKSKGRSKYPRLISIPTVRDRVVLNQLKDFLALVYPECVPKQTAAALMRGVAEALRPLDPASTLVCGCDLKDFYPSLDHQRLLKILNERIDDSRALALVRRAIVTPTVPLGARRVLHRQYSQTAGVPQGLAISNILAAIYMGPVDEAMQKKAVNYRRYVDDILMFGSPADVQGAYRSFVARARSRKLRSL